MILVTLSCFTSCQKDDFNESVEEIGESRVKRISLSDFNNKVGNNQTYAIKIDDITKFQKLKNIKENFPRKWEDLDWELEDDYTNDADDSAGTPTKYQKTLLKFIKEYDLGVSLYQMQQTNQGTPQVQETWKKLKLGLEDTIIDSQC